MDIFEKIAKRPGPLGQHADETYGYYMFPKLEGPIGSRMIFQGKTRLVWSLNDYLGLANHPEVREADAKAAKDFGMAAPMGARIMTGNSVYHEQLEKELAAFVGKESGVLVNYGFQAMLSAIDCLVDRHDVIIYDAESHACIIDGARLHMGKRFAYRHNDMESLEQQLKRATKLIEGTPGGILVITEGVFGMSGVQGDLKSIVELKKKYQFRLFVDDAHGFGTMGKTGAGTPEEQGVTDDVDILFDTFAKSMAGFGAFLCGNKMIVKYLKFNLRSQIFAKSLTMPMVIGGLKRLELIRNHPEYREKLWVIVKRLQSGLREAGFDIGRTTTPVTPVFLKGTVEEASALAHDMRENFDIFCSIVIYPVVPKGVIILRLIPSASHSIKDVDETIAAFKIIKSRLEAGAYKTSKIIASAEMA